MKFKNSCKFDLICPTSMGVRITPVDRQVVYTSNMFRMQATSAESNVINVAASLGKKCAVLTKFVKDSPIAQFIKNELGKRHIDYIGKSVDQGGPWGFRHQFNIADSGYGLRGPRVANDRTGEVGLTLSVDDFDLKQIFEVDGVKMIHLSGLIAALSPETSKFCLELARKAKETGTVITFDLNYRASFWKNREEELSKAFKEIASYADVLIGNEEDFQLALGVKGPEAGGKNISSQIESFKGMIIEAHKAYPNVKVFATTLREVISANRHLWGAISYSNGEFYYIEPKEIDVLDRIGGGDGFVGGLLYSLLCEKDFKEATNFGWATGVMAVTCLDDYATPIDEDQVISIYKGNARVKR